MGMTVIEMETMAAVKSACRKYTERKIDWEQRRYEIAKDVLCAIIEKEIFPSDLCERMAVMKADALIEELKKKGE